MFAFQHLSVQPSWKKLSHGSSVVHRWIKNGHDLSEMVVLVLILVGRCTVDEAKGGDTET